VFPAVAGPYAASYGAAPGGAGAGTARPPVASGSGSAAGGSRAADRKAPRIAIRPRTVRASRKGTFTVRMSCPRGERRCFIKVRVRSGRRDLARRTVTLAGGKTAKVTLRLTKAARRRLARSRSLNAVVLAAARDQAGNRATTKTRIHLLAPRRR
jgi:hypothetical protein